MKQLIITELIKYQVKENIVYKVDEEKRQNIEGLLKSIDEKTLNERGEMLRDIESMDISDDHKQALFIVIEEFSKLSVKGKKHLMYCVQIGEWVPTYVVPRKLGNILGL